MAQVLFMISSAVVETWLFSRINTITILTLHFHSVFQHRRTFEDKWLERLGSIIEEVEGRFSLAVLGGLRLRVSIFWLRLSSRKPAGNV